MIDTQTTQPSEIAQRYLAKVTFQFEFFGEDQMNFNEITSREKAYEFIRESVTQTIMGLGFDSWGDIYDSVEITESEEKI